MAHVCTALRCSMCHGLRQFGAVDVFKQATGYGALIFKERLPSKNVCRTIPKERAALPCGHEEQSVQGCRFELPALASAIP